MIRIKGKFFSKIKEPRIRTALYCSIVDGMLWAMMYGLAENYIVPFALLFNATVLQVTFISASNQLGIGIGQLLGARFINNFPSHRKIIPIISNAIHASAWVLIFLLTMKSKNIYFIICIYFLGVLTTNFAGPSWVSWMNDLVPEKLRGEFWGGRNRLLGIFQFIGIISAGLFLYYFKNAGKELLAFGILFSAASLFRFSSIFPLQKMHEPPMHVPAKEKVFRFKIFLTKLTTTNFGKFSLFCFLMTFSVNFMAPLIPIFVLKFLGFNYIQYTIIIMLSLILSFIFMNYWGPLSDKYGNYRILFITSVVLPLLSIMWIFVRNFYLLCCLQVLSGFVWAGFNLSVSNYIFDAVRKENISKIMAYFNSLNNFSAFTGSILCGVAVNFIDHYFRLDNKVINKFIIIFFISSLLRTLILIFFSKEFKEVRDVEPSPPARFFYIFKPLNDFINAIQFIGYNIKKRFKR